MGLDLRSPDHTTLSPRGQHLDLTLRRFPKRAGLHLIIDSTGLSIVGEGEWAAAKHGGRGTRGWKKLHVGVDHTGVIVAHVLTDATVDDATTGVELIEAVNDDITKVTADAAYDTVTFYDAAGARGATVVVPPAKTARVSRRRPRSSARDRTITKVKRIGRRRWKKTSRYHQQARVENAFFRVVGIEKSQIKRSVHVVFKFALELVGIGLTADRAEEDIQQFAQRNFDVLTAAMRHATTAIHVVSDHHILKPFGFL